MSKITSVRVIDSFTDSTLLYLEQEQRERDRAELARDPEYLEWCEEMDRADEQYRLEHCPVHECELRDGVCLRCAEEELIADL